MKSRGLEKTSLEMIQDLKGDKIEQVNVNLSLQREEWGTRLVGAVEDANEMVKEKKNKIYLR